jgi:hypothetical protein
MLQEDCTTFAGQYQWDTLTIPPRHSSSARMISTTLIAICQADLADLGAIQRISADAYAPAHMAALGVIPRPAVEDYRPRIERGEVWLLEAGGEPIA